MQCKLFLHLFLCIRIHSVFSSFNYNLFSIIQYISECSSSTKLKLNESTKRNAWLCLRDTSPWRATNSEECDVVWRNRYLCFLARLDSLLLKPWCIMIEQGDTTWTAMDPPEPSEAVFDIRNAYFHRRNSAMNMLGKNRGFDLNVISKQVDTQKMSLD